MYCLHSDTPQWVGVERTGAVLARVQISSVENGKTVAADVGDRLVVSLPENPTTGYRWQVDSSGSFLVLENDDFQLQQGAAMGASGTRSLTFHAIAPGRASLHLAARREWEKDKPPLQYFCVSIDVRRAEN